MSKLIWGFKKTKENTLLFQIEIDDIILFFDTERDHFIYMCNKNLPNKS